jgi:sugar/nucleoside kinase (ribokinase family)
VTASDSRPVPRRLLFAGEAIVDVAMRVPALPAPGADVLASSSRIQAGGGFNVMAAAARQGMPVLYAGGHGTGPWGDLVREALAAEGVEVLRAPDPDRDTGFAVALTAPAGGRAYVTQLGAESARPPGSMDQVTAAPDDAVYISGYGLLSPGSGPVLARWATNLPPRALLFLDPGPLVAQIPADRLTLVLRRCTWLSCNAAEATAVTGAESPSQACRLLQASVPAGGVIVRAGSAGCYLSLALLPSDEWHFEPPITGSMRHPSVVHVPAPPVVAVDTTGAGDAHAGVFLSALSDDLAPAAAAKRANAAAALSVTRPGPATCPTRSGLDTWLSRRDEGGEGETILG